MELFHQSEIWCIASMIFWAMQYFLKEKESFNAMALSFLSLVGGIASMITLPFFFIAIKITEKNVLQSISYSNIIIVVIVSISSILLSFKSFLQIREYFLE